MMYSTMLCCFPSLLQYYGVLLLLDNISVWRGGDKLAEQEDLRQIQKTNTKIWKILTSIYISHTSLTLLTYSSTSTALRVAATCTLYCCCTDSIFVAMAYNNVFLCLFHEDLKNDIPPCLSNFDLQTQHDQTNMLSLVPRSRPAFCHALVLQYWKRQKAGWGLGTKLQYTVSTSYSPVQHTLNQHQIKFVCGIA